MVLGKACDIKKREGREKEWEKENKKDRLIDREREREIKCAINNLPVEIPRVMYIKLIG